MSKERKNYIKDIDNEGCQARFTNEPGFIPTSGSNSTVWWRVYIDREKVDVCYHSERHGTSFWGGIMRIKAAAITVLRVLHILP